MIDLEPETDHVREQAFTFRQQILAPLKKRSHILYMSQIPDLETGNVDRNIAIHPWMTTLWKKVISYVEQKGTMSQRVCLVGNAGIGKTTTTAFLLRILLMRGSTTVLYHIKSSSGGWIYEFGLFGVDVYPSSELYSIPSLRSPDTFYIVDPGNSNTNCDPGPLFPPKTIIISCPNAIHWGANEFSKLRNNTVGRFLYMPMWTLTELLETRLVLSDRSQPSQSTITYRFDVFGGIPRHVLAPSTPTAKAILKHAWRLQQHAIRALRPHEVLQLVQTDLPTSMHILDVNVNVQASCLGLRVGVDKYGEHNFDLGGPTLVSKSVSRAVCHLHIARLWDTSLSPTNRVRILEAHCQAFLCSGKRSLMTKTWAGKSCCTGNYFKKENHVLGGVMRVESVSDIMESAAENQGVLYCKAAATLEPFIGDFCYRDEDNVINVFQVVAEKTRIADAVAIEKLAQMARIAKFEMALYFLVPASNFHAFDTTPVHPSVSCDIFHARLPPFV